MKITRNPVLMAFLAMLFTACHTPKNIVANLDLNNLKPGLDTFRKHHPIIYNGDVITVNINNVNKDLYTVKLSGSVVSFNTTVPASLSLSSIVLPGEEYYGPGSSNPNFKNRPTCEESIYALEGAVETAERDFKDAAFRINQLIAYNNHLLLMQKDCGLRVDDIQYKAAFELSGIIANGNIADLETFADKYIQAAADNYKAIQKDIPKLDAYFASDSCKAEIKKDKVQNFSVSEKADLASLKDINDKIVTFDQTGQKYVIIQNYKAITEPSNYRFSLVDTAHNADEVNFNVKISPKNWMPCRAVDTSFNINLKVARFKIDFSTGLFLNFGGSSFTGKNYFIDSTGRIGQINKNSNVTIPSIGALAHFYYRSTSAIDPGLVLGTSLSTDVKYTNFHVGLSLMFNANNEVFNRIALSGGLTYRYVSELNNAYSVGQTVNSSLTIDQLETGKFIRGGFIALTYNLSKN
jgi:hypothetical protein